MYQDAYKTIVFGRHFFVVFVVTALRRISIEFVKSHCECAVLARSVQPRCQTDLVQGISNNAPATKFNLSKASKASPKLWQTRRSCMIPSHTSILSHYTQDAEVPDPHTFQPHSRAELAKCKKEEKEKLLCRPS